MQLHLPSPSPHPAYIVGGVGVRAISPKFQHITLYWVRGRALGVATDLKG